MTRAEIIAELRRSAREDADPWYEVGHRAFWFTVDWYDMDCGCNSPEVERTFFLLVAHALEDEC